jgi:hypothetical protein
MVTDFTAEAKMSTITNTFKLRLYAVRQLLLNTIGTNELGVCVRAKEHWQFQRKIA